MLLAIDSGNTNIVFAVFSDTGDLQGEWRAGTESNRTADEFGIWLSQLLEKEGIEKQKITSAIIATVVPDNLAHLKLLCLKYFNCDAMVIGDPEVELGLEILIDHPREVGADRLCNAVAAHDTYGGPLLILDFGTATTFDVIYNEGDYCGGAIYPGINLSLEALHHGAAKLPRVAIDKPDAVIGKDTVSAMRSGIFWGHVSMIEGMVARISNEFGCSMKVVATGGLADLFHTSCDAIDICDPSLTLRGLFTIFKANEKHRDTNR